MAGAIADAFVNVRANTQGFQGEVSRGVTSAFRGMGRTILGLAGTYGLGSLFSDAATNASDLNESLNAVSVSYGDLGDAAVNELFRMGEGAAVNMGMTQTAFNEAAVRFNAFSRNIAEGSGADVVDVLGDITGRATDFASVMNLEVADAQQLFQSGLAGETEPLRRFGIDISAARVEAYALSEGIASNYEELSEAEKQMIRWNLILDQTNQMEGDFTNTSHMLANAMRIAKAQVETLGLSFGQGLLPGLQDAVNGFNEFAPTLEPLLADAGKAVGDALLPAFDAVGPAIAALLVNIVPVIEDIATMIGAIAPIITPLVEVFGALAQVVSGVLASAFEALTPVFEVVGTFLSDLATTILDILGPALVILSPILKTIGTLFADALGQILPIIIDLLAQIGPEVMDLASAFGELITGALVTILPIIVDLFTTLGAAIAPLIPIVMELFNDVFAALLPVIVTLFEELGPVVEEIAIAFSGALAEALPEIAEAFVQIFEAIEPLIPILADGLLVVLETLEPILPELVQGFIALKIATAAFGVAQTVLGNIMRANPFFLVVSAIAALALGLKIAYDRSETFRRIVDQMWQKLQEVWDWVSTTGVNVWHRLQEVLDDLSVKFDEVFEAVRGFVEEKLGFVREYAQGIIDFFGGLVDTVKQLFDGEWGAAWDTFVQTVIDFAGEVVAFLSGLGGLILEGIGNVAPILLQKGKDLLNGLWQGIQAIWDDPVLPWLSGLPQLILDTLIDLGELLLDLGGKLMSSLWTGIQFVWSTFVWPFLQSLPGLILSGLGELGLLLLAKGGDLIRGLWNGIQLLWPVILQFFKDLPGNIASAISFFVETGTGALGQIGQKLIEAILNGVRLLWPTLKQWFTDLPGNIVNAISFIASGAGNLGRIGMDMLGAILNGVRDFWPTLKQWFLDLAGNVVSAAGGFMKGAGGALGQVGKDIINAIKAGVDVAWTLVTDFFGSIITNIRESLPSGDEMLQAGMDFFRPFVDGIETILRGLVRGYNAIPLLPDIDWDGWSSEQEAEAEEAVGGVAGVVVGGFAGGIAGGIGGANFLPTGFSWEDSLLADFEGDVFEEPGADLMAGLHDGLENGQFTVSVWLLGLQARMKTWLGQLTQTFASQGMQLLQGLRVGMIIGEASVMFQTRGLRTRLVSWLGTTTTLFVSAGMQLMTGLVSGMTQGLTAVMIRVASVRTTLVSGMQTSTLWVTAGAQLVNGLMNGINGAIGVLGLRTAGFRGQLNTILGDTSTLWYDEGAQLVEGLMRGINSRIAALNFQIGVLKLQTSNLSSFHTGGIVPGGPNQEVLAVLQGGERVLTAKQQQDGFGGTSITFGEGSIQVQFAGAMPTNEQARSTGEQVGAGILAALSRQKIRTLARTAGSQ